MVFLIKLLVNRFGDEGDKGMEKFERSKESSQKDWDNIGSPIFDSFDIDIAEFMPEEVVKIL